MLKNKKIIIGICGSFCNHQLVLNEIKKLVLNNEVKIIVSENVNKMSTRFFDRADFMEQLESITKNKIISTLFEAEKIGPDNYYDIMAIVPMSATICAKLVNGIYDSPVTLGAKAMIRNNKNIVIGLASNDGLGMVAPNFFRLLNIKHIYTLPFSQDAPFLKPYSIISKWTSLEATLASAFDNIQIQPILAINNEGEK
ncbi:MAG: dipicolinate synthase subunit B [Erysipelotrichaceae bacterium]